MANKEKVLAVRISLNAEREFDKWLEGVNALREKEKLEPLKKSDALRAVMSRAVRMGPVLLMEGM